MMSFPLILHLSLNVIFSSHIVKIDPEHKKWIIRIDKTVFEMANKVDRFQTEIDDLWDSVRYLRDRIDAMPDPEDDW